MKHIFRLYLFVYFAAPPMLMAERVVMLRRYLLSPTLWRRRPTPGLRLQRGDVAWTRNTTEWDRQLWTLWKWEKKNESSSRPTSTLPPDEDELFMKSYMKALPKRARMEARISIMKILIDKSFEQTTQSTPSQPQSRQDMPQPEHRQYYDLDQNPPSSNQSFLSMLHHEQW